MESADQLRPNAPPDDAASATELDEVIAATPVANGADFDRIAYWDAGSPGYRWNEIAMQHTLRMGFGPGDAYRTMALLNAATLGGAAEMLAYLFPADAAFFQSRADQGAASRMWSGIHFRSACDVGVRLGRDVGNAVVEHAMTDGAD